MEDNVHINAGGIILEGLLSVPSSATTGVVICHPHPLRGGDMHSNVVAALVERFDREGTATLRFNFRGVGASTGTHDNGQGEQDDVRAAVGLLRERLPSARIVVAGYSFGSMVCLRAGSSDERVQALIGVALPIAARDQSFLADVAKPTLLISGNRDDYSPEPGLRDLANRPPCPKSVVIIDGADHFFWGLEGKVADAAVAFLTTSA